MEDKYDISDAPAILIKTKLLRGIQTLGYYYCRECLEKNKVPGAPSLWIDEGNVLFIRTHGDIIKIDESKYEKGDLKCTGCSKDF